MKLLAAALLVPLSLASLWQRATRETNSHAANVRGVKAFAAKQYAKAAEAFGIANAAKGTPADAFNLGTADVAAGRHEDGAAALGKAMADPALRQGALYNRGNGALAANAYDPAIRDYTEALRLAPGDAQAKRNLEIAWLRKQQQQEQSRNGQQQGAGGQQQKQQQKQPAPGAQRNERGDDQTAEALLRAVQQQEQEELNRMKRARAQRGRVGW